MGEVFGCVQESPTRERPRTSLAALMTPPLEWERPQLPALKILRQLPATSQVSRDRHWHTWNLCWAVTALLGFWALAESVL